MKPLANIGQGKPVSTACGFNGAHSESRVSSFTSRQPLYASCRCVVPGHHSLLNAQGYSNHLRSLTCQALRSGIESYKCQSQWVLAFSTGG